MVLRWLRAAERASRDTEAKALCWTSCRLAAEREKVARGFIAIEAVGRTTPAITTSSEVVEGGAERWVLRLWWCVLRQVPFALSQLEKVALALQCCSLTLLLNRAAPRLEAAKEY
jgi:hypothetical protein